MKLPYVITLVGIICSHSAVFAQETREEKTNHSLTLDVTKLQYPVRVEPSFEKSPSSAMAIGTKTTVFTPLKLRTPEKQKGGAVELLEPLSRAEFDKLGIGMNEWLNRAGKEMDAMLGQLPPGFEKVKAGEKPSYALLEWDHPLAPSLIFAPSFADIFRKELGKSLLVAIPDRSHIYVFPGDGLKISEFLETLQLTFKNSTTSVSNELFLFRKDDVRPRVIGTYLSQEE